MTVTVTTPTLTALMLITFPASELVSGAVIQETSLVTVEQWRRTVTAPTLHSHNSLVLLLEEQIVMSGHGSLLHSLIHSLAQETQLAHIRILFQSKFKLNRRIGAHLMLCNGTLYPRPIAL